MQWLPPGVIVARPAVFDENGEVEHEREVVESQRRLCFVALKFQHSILSDTLLAVGRDAAHVVDRPRERSKATAPV